ncbi:MAG: hypothetical protein EHM47_12430 [Ignavibacteriales bacterium]|nr:MAG: hypothetical protein EHM47_12430 [Ignavibacteriales bacterium]
MQEKENSKAKYYIDRAYELNSSDPALFLYKGLNLEFSNKTEEAIAYYQKYDQLPLDSPYRELLEGRYLWLKRQKVYTEIDSLANETDLSSGDISTNTLAVFPLIYHGYNEDYVPLSRGFSEMISIDLAKVNNLTILERIRIQAVIDELKFSQSPSVNQSSAPRAGKLLKAGTIVSGDYDITEDKEFSINLASWDVLTSEQKSRTNVSGDLNDLFELQKRVVFSFLEKNGIELTQEEKEAIAYIPTQNLDAFLFYSKGLVEEDAGNFKGAETFYNNALQIDPNFGAAGNKLETSQALGKAGGSKELVVSVLKTVDPVIKVQSPINIVSSRLQSLGNNISSNFIQGLDSRNPAQDQGAGIILPEPPPPPAR